LLLPLNELPEYLPEAIAMSTNDQAKFLARANTYCIGIIGGVPIYTPEYPAEPVKTAVALAYEIFAEGQTAQTNPVNGSITEAAPTGFYVRKADNPLDVVDKMLMAYSIYFKRTTIIVTDAANGVQFL